MKDLYVVSLNTFLNIAPFLCYVYVLLTHAYYFHVYLYLLFVFVKHTLDMACLLY